MYIAYSALRTADPNTINTHTTENEMWLRYRAYQESCSKYSCHITEIQKYFPNWMPEFR
jgi:hypothetical protein